MPTLAVVDDNFDNRTLIQRMLQRLYQVTVYASGAEALEGLRGALPDLVLLDISMPDMDGTEVLRRIRADERLKRLPVIALTAHAMTGDREKYLAMGFNDYVTKPIVDRKILYDAITRHLPRPDAPGAPPAPPGPAARPAAP